LIPPEKLNDEYHKNGALEITDARWLFARRWKKQKTSQDRGAFC
jgi:hypothetical protein